MVLSTGIDSGKEKKCDLFSIQITTTVKKDSVFYTVLLCRAALSGPERAPDRARWGGGKVFRVSPQTLEMSGNKQQEDKKGKMRKAFLPPPPPTDSLFLLFSSPLIIPSS